MAGLAGRVPADRNKTPAQHTRETMPPHHDPGNMTPQGQKRDDSHRHQKVHGFPARTPPFRQMLPEAALPT
jgi:hypothetical protein